MTNDNDNLDQRLAQALGGSAAPQGADDILDPQTLSKRKPRARNPHAVRKTAAGSLVGLSSVALVGVLVTTFWSPTPDPLFTLAEGSGGAATSEMADSDLRMGWFVNYEYVAGEGLGTEGGRGQVYSLDLQGTPQALLTSLGSYFGVSGSPVESEYSDPQWPLFVVGSEDWTAPSINVTWNGTGSWYYNNPAAYPEPVCTEVPSSEGISEERYLDCVTPPPSGPLPSAEQAKRDAVGIFAASGLAVTESDIRVLNNDEWGVGVSASLIVDGQETALEWTAFWSPGPVLASASGHAVVANNRGVFDTISPTAAVDRLTAGNWWGSPSPGYYDFGGGMDGVARETLMDTPAVEPEVEPVTPDTGESEPGLDPDQPVASDDPPSEEIPGEETPGDEIPGEEPIPLPEPEPDVVDPVVPEPEFPEEPETIIFTVSSAEEALLLVWDASGNAWLVPGYILRHGSEMWDWSPVISVVDGVIEVPEPQLIGIMPVPEPYLEEGE